MLKLFSHFWLILSLLVAPLPYAVADIAMADQGQMQCENAGQHAQHNEQSVQTVDTEKQSCECCDQCESACVSCLHFSAGISPLNNFPDHPSYDVYPSPVIDSAVGISLRTEFRPPRKLHA